MEMFKKIMYFMLSIKEKTLSIRLGKHLKKSSSKSTSKTIVDSNTTMTFSSETEKNVKLVKNSIEKLLQEHDYDPYKLLEYIEKQGTKIHKIKDADKLLNMLNEEEGFIPEHKGLDGLYLNIITANRFSTSSEAMFIMREGQINPFYMVHQFYKWYSYKSKLPGYDYESQKLFRKFMHSKTQQGMENLNLDDMIGLKEAIARDKEATDFAYNYAKGKEGSEKAFGKMIDGGASL